MWSALPKSAEQRRTDWRGISSSWPPPRRRARKCVLPALAIGWSASGARRGSGGTGLWRRRVGPARCGTRWPGRFSAWLTLRAVVFVASRPGATAGEVLLVLAAGARLSAYVGATVGEIGFLRGFWLDGSRRMAWLEDYAASMIEHADTPAPERLSEGIRFEHVSFAYPGTSRRVLEDVCLELKPGAVVAIVGENGAGKSTLVKLLCRMYEPEQGRILVDGVDLARIRADEWRERLAGAFQDFFRFEFRAQQSVGVGDVPRLENQPAVTAAVDRAGADDVVEKLACRTRDAARPHLAGRRGRQLRPMAEARSGPRVHARSSAAAGAGRTHRRVGRRDRARFVRALRGGGVGDVRRRATAALPSWCRIGSAP